VNHELEGYLDDEALWKFDSKSPLMSCRGEDMAWCYVHCP
jgi:hypothetical protein